MHPSAAPGRKNGTPLSHLTRNLTGLSHWAAVRRKGQKRSAMATALKSAEALLTVS